MSDSLAYWIEDSGDLVNRDTGERLKRARHQKLLQDLPEDAMPARPRADKKERTFNLLIRDGVDRRGNRPEADLIGDSAGDRERKFSTAQEIPEEYRELFGEILDDHYVIEASGGVRFLFPFQSLLPGAFKFFGREKMFTGKILAFLCQPSEDSDVFNSDLIDRFYELFNGAKGLTLLDNTVLDIAEREANGAGSEARSETLIARYYGQTPQAPGALIPAVHLRFQKDMESVLSVKKLNRRDLVSHAVNIFYLHLALYFQRLGWLLEEEFGLALEAMNDLTVPLDRAFACFGSDWDDSPFAGTIGFRVARSQPAPVTMRDGCVRSYAEQLRRQLLLPANLSVLGAARQIMKASGQLADQWSFAEVARVCRDDNDLCAAFNEALWYMAAATVSDRPLQDREDIARQISAKSPGIEVFREALLKTRRSDLRRRGRDIIHALVLRGGRGYIAQRGRSLYFFEIGQDLLLLLSKVIVGDSQMPFRQFMKELRRYGFAPQDRDEEDRLANTLRGLNLLEKHSDAGEAMYVKHFL